MSIRSKLSSGPAVLAFAQITNQACVFLRNVVIVRTLTKTDYGIAATFMIAIAFVQASTDLNVGKLLIQAPDGEEESFQRSAQLMRFLQGLFVSAILFLLAPVMAQVFDVPGALSAYRMLAVIPLIHGLTHMDANRYQRNSRFGPMALMESGAQLFSLVLVCVLAQEIGDYTLVVWSLISIPASYVLISHLLANRSYRWAIEPSYARRTFRFGWPLLLNGFFMVLITQGDRALLGSAESLNRLLLEWFSDIWEATRTFDKADLAVYSLALSLAIMPWQFLVRTLGRLLFPVMSRLQDDRAALRRIYISSAAVFAACGVSVAAVFILGGGSVIAIIYSEQYRAAEPIIAFLGATQAIRMIRLTATSLLLALADTEVLLYANIARAVSLLGTLGVIISRMDLVWVAASALLAEAVALSVSLALLRRRHGFEISLLFGPALFSVAGIGGAFALRQVGLVSEDLAKIALAGLYALLVPAVASVVLPRFLPGLRTLLGARRSQP